MHDISFYHCADVHLDSPFTSLADKQGLPSQRRKGLLDVFSKLVRSAAEEKPDFLFIAGDLFENDYSRFKTISVVNDLFSTIPETNIIMISGNHDPEAANSFYTRFDWGDNVYFLGDKDDSVYFESLETMVHGIGYGAGSGYIKKLNHMNVDSEKYNVLLFHGDVDLQIGDRDYNSVSSEVLESKGFDYVAAGHNHRNRKYGNIIYNPGSLSPLGFDEPGEHGYFKGVISKGNLPDVEYIKCSDVEYITMEADITGITDDTEAIDMLSNMTESENRLYKILLKGTKSIDYSPDIELISRTLLESTMFSKVRDESRIMISAEELSLLKGLKGEFASSVLSLMNDASDEEKELLEKALYYGVEAIDKGTIEKAGGIEF